jgi:transposase
MARAYSEDLRIRIVKAYEQGLGSIREIAKQFQVGKNFVNDLLQVWKKTGSVSPQRQGGGVKPKLEEIHLQKLQKMVEEKNDITLEELSERLEEETGLKVSLPTICRGLQKLGLTRKKKLFTTLSKNPKK